MTVCIAARSHNIIFGVADRMITSGDVQFEPLSGKITSVTNSIAVMMSGDAAFHAEVMSELLRRAHIAINKEPNSWLSVKQTAEEYINIRAAIKARRAESHILAPLGLTHSTFLDRQQTMSSALVDRLAEAILQFTLPHVEALVVGIDSSGPHIFTIRDGSLSCDDAIGFSAIGSGWRHAESQFMQARHSWVMGMAPTLMTAYTAKRRAEVAPGVGKDTDLFMVGPNLGQSAALSDLALSRLEAEYDRLAHQERKIQEEAHNAIGQFLDELSSRPGQDQAVTDATEASDLQTDLVEPEKDSAPSP
jgi:20S proteasome alpha/beta subunit